MSAMDHSGGITTETHPDTSTGTGEVQGTGHSHFHEEWRG